ncbi:nucleoside/nucleotide kinase family protein [Cognatishimia sp. F0-27]|nr:nucleoside/nucleotide kinase family protein [Cognatishimia sp. F0-27]
MADQAFTAVSSLGDGRRLIALAGPPAAGKSTVSELLLRRLLDTGRSAVLVPMDGFHLDNRLLESRGLLHRKGAPETFDAAGFGHLINRIRAGESAVYPVFDRSRDLAIAGAGEVTGDAEFVLVEGNYLLLNRGPWQALASLWDYAIWIDAPRDQLRHRLMQRWRDEGLTEEVAREKVDGNDMPNVDLLLNNRSIADLVLSAEP